MPLSVNIGAKIKALRLASDLTQQELADRAKLTKGFISQLENEQSSISVDSLVDILDVLGVTLPEFFSEASRAKVVFGPTERVAVEGMGVSKFELLIPGSTNNEMDPVLLELRPGEGLEEEEPFAGQVFGFVLKGFATLRLDKASYKVPANSCFYFRADQTHQIANTSGGKVVLLTVTSPPQM